MSSKRKSTSNRSAKNKAKAYVSEDEEEAFTQSFDVVEKVNSKDFPKFFVKEMKGDEVTLEHFQRQGFSTPLFIPDKAGLNMTVPDPTFTVSDVRGLVGGKRVLEVRLPAPCSIPLLVCFRSTHFLKFTKSNSRHSFLGYI